MKTETIEAEEALEAEIEGEEVAIVPSAAINPHQMLQLAIERGADMNQLERFMDLADRYEAKESKKLYIAAMAQFRADCPEIIKTRQAHNSKYAGLAESICQISPAMSANGLSHAWLTEQAEGEGISVTCSLTHVGGHSERTKLIAPPDTSGSKNVVQAIASTITYLERYTLYALLGLASKDEDTDGNNIQQALADLEPALNAIAEAPDIETLRAVAKNGSAQHRNPGDKQTLLHAYNRRKAELATTETESND